MSEHHFIEFVLFAVFFLLLSTVVKLFSKKTSFPYTIALLAGGFLSRFIFHELGIEQHFMLSTNAIYFILLPLLLFESASQIQIHQFRLQFKTISFLATFGLLISIATVGVLTSWTLGLPLIVGLLFGSIISATDPIAVLALFKSLNAPKRLSLIMEGESMFNDATAVIVFRVLLAIAIGHEAIEATGLALTTLEFLFVFIGSIITGAVMGLIVSSFIERINNDRILETTLTVGLALGSFVIGEHFLELSGVICTVAAGLTLGNIGKTRISSSVVAFMNEFWEYLAFLAVSLVFFFATFALDFQLLFNTIPQTLIVIAIVLLARSLSVYATFFFSNHLAIFKDEPNIPTSWQHLINWSGLRGVIPLVLVNTLPDNFPHAELLQIITLEIFLYSVIFHGLTIKLLMKLYKLHIPERKKMIQEEEHCLFSIDAAEEKLEKLKRQEVDKKVIRTAKKQLKELKKSHERKLKDLSAEPEELLESLRYESLGIERKELNKMFHEGHISETIFFEFEAELDLQEDAIEYPEVSKGRAVSEGGKIKAAQSFRKRLRRSKELLARWPVFKALPFLSEERLVQERIGLLRARIICGQAVLQYLDHLSKFFAKRKKTLKVVGQLREEFTTLENDNHEKLIELENKYPQYSQKYFQNVLKHCVLKNVY